MIVNEVNPVTDQHDSLQKPYIVLCSLYQTSTQLRICKLTMMSETAQKKEPLRLRKRRRRDRAKKKCRDWGAEGSIGAEKKRERDRETKRQRGRKSCCLSLVGILSFIIRNALKVRWRQVRPAHDCPLVLGRFLDIEPNSPSWICDWLNRMASYSRLLASMHYTVLHY